MKILEVALKILKNNTIFIVSTLAALISLFIVPPSKSYAGYIDYQVIALLFCLMLVVVGLSNAGVFEAFINMVIKYVHSSKGILLFLILVCFFSSMFITNDVSLVLFVPLTVLMLTKLNMKELMIQIIVLQTIAANLGSMCTPFGNPQNLYLYTVSHMSAFEFFTTLLPYTAFSLFLLLAAVFFLEIRTSNKFNIKKAANESNMTRLLTRKTPLKICVFLILFLICLLTVIHCIDYRITLILVILTVAIIEPRLFFYVDYPLLLTFIAFFILIGNLRQMAPIYDFLKSNVIGHEFMVSVISSQFISNVPAAVLLSSFTTDLKSLMIGTDIGGPGTLIASMASLISYGTYSATEKSNKSKYLCCFTIYNILFLVALCLFHSLMVLL